MMLETLIRKRIRAVADVNILEITPKLEELKMSLGRVVQGKDEALDLVIIAVLANGSVLMEDVPGVGKTTLAKALAKSLDAALSRVQFTPDLLPADILGGSIYNPAEGTLKFQPGPIFCNILLADEINRASPRTQSALLEAMSEGQATVEGQQRPLSAPFLVLATQNPVEFHGTYPLPEAQLDRFLLQLDLGYPDAETEVDILYSQAQHHPIEGIEPVMSGDEVLRLQKTVRKVVVERSISEYLVEITNRTRRDDRLKLGVSPRGSLMMFRAAQAAALLNGRTYVLPDDVKQVAVHVLAHRLILTPKAKYSGISKRTIIDEIVSGVKVPT